MQHQHPTEHLPAWVESATQAPVNLAQLLQSPIAGIGQTAPAVEAGQPSFVGKVR
ncbi:hypothetical protein KS527_004475 [Salmonella enterica]|nr:hypothetical protein [Salmonella enterica]EJF7575719.1 hypothetical protein [Salmonella enterica subsp. enterica]